MKFAYVDESGSKTEGDVFTMVGLLIDAYRLPKCTRDFDQRFKDFCALHPASPADFKTKKFINGKGGWRQIDPDHRKQFLRDIVNMVAGCATIYAYALSFKKYDAQLANSTDLPANQNSYWVSSGMFISGLIQKKMQKESNNKGLTVLVFDDNKVDMPKVSGGLYEGSEWYDGLHAYPKKKRGKNTWLVNTPRFDHIINTAFAVKSEHASLVLVADALSYIYRRHLELTSRKEAWDGEKEYYEELVGVLESRREKLGRTPPDSEAVDFYKASKHEAWDI